MALKFHWSGTWIRVAYNRGGSVSVDLVEGDYRETVTMDPRMLNALLKHGPEVRAALNKPLVGDSVTYDYSAPDPETGEPRVIRE